MSNQLNEADFTSYVAERLSALGVTVGSSQPLTINVEYGAGEPVLSLRLNSAYEDYCREPHALEQILLPLTTEVGWTINGKRYAFKDVAEHALPVLRDLLRRPWEAEESGTDQPQAKGPVVYQELVNRPEERVVAQFVMAKNEIIRPLHTGDMLRSYPDPNQFSSIAVGNLRRVASEIGLTMSEYPIENFGTVPWLVGFKGGVYRQFLAALITVPEVIATIEKTINAEDGLVAILPARDKLIVNNSTSEVAICEMGLLARYLRDESEDPVSTFVWHFKDGALKRVQTVELTEEEVPDEDDEEE